MFVRLVQWWIILSAAFSCAGWTLSYFGELNGRGYALFFLGFGVWMFFAAKALHLNPIFWKREMQKLRPRFRRWAPFLFLVMLALSTLGGLLYFPIHGDSQSYRVPTVLHWLWEQRWHWIHTGDVRMNVVAPGCQWMWAPGFLFLPGQRWLFVYNAISLLLLPGLLFGLFREVGVRARVAWWWMWVLPAAYGYALQAGGISTDAYATIYALAAVVFALRARRTHRVEDLLISLLGAALMTGAKQTNLLLMPVWFVPFILNWRLLWQRPGLTFLTCVFALGASCLPISYLNTKYAGNWQGFTDTRTFVPQSLLYGVIGNALALPAQNLLPPVLPLADKWNGAMQRFRETPFGSKFAGFEDFAHLYRMPSDMTGGLGLFLCALLLASYFLTTRRHPLVGERIIDRMLRWTLVWLPWPLLIVFMAKVGTATNARYLAPMYPFLILGLLLRRGSPHRIRAWRAFAYTTSVVTILLLVSSRQRPLFPVQTLCAAAEKVFPRTSAVGKVKNAYAYFQEHAELMGKVALALPSDSKIAGYATEVGFLESALWLPFGTRRVYRFTGTDSREMMLSKGVRFVVAEETVLKTSGSPSMEAWVSQIRGQVLKTFPLRRLGPEARVETVYLVDLN